MDKKQQQRRSLKNVARTKKYYLPYMGTSIFLSWSLLLMLYGFVLYRISEIARADIGAPIQSIVIIATLIATAIGLLILGAAVLAAHRIAGVHIKIQDICERIKEGDIDARLQFRSTDKLDEVQGSFNGMMDALQERIEHESATESTSEEDSDQDDDKGETTESL